MGQSSDTGRSASAAEFMEAERILGLHPSQQENHPSAVKSDTSKLKHINTYGSLPKYYLDQPFVCRNCGKKEIWKAKDQKWYYEDAKGHIDAKAVRCHACRVQR